MCQTHQTCARQSETVLIVSLDDRQIQDNRPYLRFPLGIVGEANLSRDVDPVGQGSPGTPLHGCRDHDCALRRRRAKRADRVKLIFWDGTGMVLVSKRLEDGKFRWPGVQDAILRLSAAELQALLEGLDWRRVHEPRQTAVPTATS